MKNNSEIFLSLVRFGLGNTNKVQISQNVDWEALETLAVEQGLSAILVDGIERLPIELRPPKLVLLQWIGETLQRYEHRYDLYRRTIAEMATFYNAHGFKMMVLKGYVCSLDWPKPEHRPCGDIDIWQFGRYKEADKVLECEKGIEIDISHHHHTVYNWGDFTVENHYDFVNVYSHKSSRELEMIFKDLGRDDTHTIDVDGESVYLPSPNLHSLFLMRHALNHFAASGINLRQVLDWAFFVEKHTNEIDWNWLMGVIEKYHMKEFFGLINAICVEDLGFPTEVFPLIQFNPVLKDRVLNDILEPEYPAVSPKKLLPRLIYKYRRWQGNAWKHELCYNESRWSAFCSGIWAKLLKPATI